MIGLSDVLLHFFLSVELIVEDDLVIFHIDNPLQVSIRILSYSDLIVTAVMALHCR